MVSVAEGFDDGRLHICRFRARDGVRALVARQPVLEDDFALRVVVLPVEQDYVVGEAFVGEYLRQIVLRAD